MYKICVLFNVITGVLSTGSLIEDQIPKCSNECAVTGIHKFFYIPSKTYTYDYLVKTSAILEGVPNYMAKVTWHTEVDLSWISPCDVVVTLRNQFTPEDNAENPKLPFMEQFPLVAAISGGVIQKICAHPEDPVYSVNFKKGIVSILQNSLPAFSPIYSNKSIEELDTVGLCSTQYELESKESVFVVKKFKNHKECTNRSLESESLFSKFLFDSYFPFTKSESSCRQEIKDGIFQRVSCINKNCIRFNNKKYMKYEQHSEFQYLREKHKMPQNLSDIETFRITNLMSEKSISDGSSKEMEIEISKLLDNLCNNSLQGILDIAPQLVSDLIDQLSRSKTETLVSFFRKITTNKLCTNASHLKSIFLDILNYVNQEGSMKVMIQQLLNGHASSFRREMYIASIFLWQDVTEKVLEYLIPIFKHPSTAPQMLSLMSATLIRKYCQIHANCAQEASIKSIFKELGNELNTYCPLSSILESPRLSSLTALKSIGNIGYMDSQLQHQVFKCILSKRTDTAVQVAAIESLRRNVCSKEFTEKLLRITSNYHQKGELRVAAFLGVIRCADQLHVKHLFLLASNETDTNVKSFIFSYFKGILDETFPNPNRKLKEYLAFYSAPLHAEPETSTKSTNYEYYFKSLGSGLRANLNVMKFPETASMKYNTKIQLAHLFKIFEESEISFRIENFKDVLPYVLEKISESENSLIKALKPFLISLLSGKKAEAFSEEGNFKASNSTAKSRIDAQYRIFGVEFLYLSLQNDSLLFKNNFMEILWTEILASSQTIEMFLKGLSSVRALHFNSETLVPSIHGIELLATLQTTSLFGINVEKISSDISCSKEKSLSCLSLTPKFSTTSQILIGYDFQSFVGLNITSNLHLSDELIFILESKKEQMKVHLQTLKDEFAILSSNTYVQLQSGQTSNNAGREVKSFIKRETCLHSKFRLPGFNLCWKYNLPNFDTNVMVPFGQYSFGFHLKKANQNIKNLQLTSSWKSEKKSFEINIKLNSVDDTEHPKLSELKISIVNKEKYFSVSSYLTRRNDGNDLGMGIKVSIEKTSTKRGFKNDISLFFSNTVRFTSSDKILYLKYICGSEDDNTTVDIKLQTINGLATIAKFNFEAEFDYVAKEKQFSTPQATVSETNRTASHSPLRIPLKKSLGMHLKDVLEHPFNERPILNRSLRMLSFKKLNLDLESGTLHANIFVQRVTFDHLSSQFRFWATAKVGNIKETIKGDVAIKGLKNDRSITISSDIYSESSTSNCHIKTELVHDQRKFGYGFRIENMDTEETLFLIRYTKERKSPNNINFASNAEILIYGYVPHYAIEGEIVESELGTYLIKYVVMKNGTRQSSIDGHIGLHSGINFTKERLHLNISGFTGGPYEFKGGYEISNYKRKIVISLVNLNTQIFYNRMALHRPLDCNACYTYSHEIQVPKFIEGKLDGEFSSADLKFSSMVTLLPETESKIELKSYFCTDFVKNQIEARLVYDIQKKQKVEIISHYDISNDKRFLYLKGKLNAFSEEYKYILEGSLGTPLIKDVKRHFLVDVTKPSRENFRFETLFHKDVFDDYKGDTTMLLHLITFGKEEYKWNSNFCYSFEANSSGLTVMGRADFKTPLISGVTLKFETTSNSTEGNQLITAKINMSSPTFPTVSCAKLSFSMYPPNQKTESSLVFPRIPLDLNVDIQNWGNKETNLIIQVNSTKDNSIFIGFIKNGNRQLSFNLNHRNESECSFHIVTPSKTMGVTFQISLKGVVTLTLYPNPEWRTARFDLKKLDAFNILSNMAIEQTAMQGSINVNGSSSGPERIIVSIESIKLSNGSYKTEAIFRSSYLKSNPRFLLETAFTPSTKSVSVRFHHSASDPSSFLIGGVYSIYPPNDRQKSFYGFFTSPRHKIEFTSSRLDFSSTEAQYANNTFINGTLYISSSGLVDYATHYCSNPSTFMMTTESKEKSSQIFSYYGEQQRHFRLSFENRKHSEVNEKKSDVLEDARNEALRFSAKLLTPSLVSFEYVYNLFAIKSYADSIWVGLNDLFSLTTELTAEVLDEVFSKSLEPNSQESEFRGVVAEVAKELHDLYKDMELDQLLPDFSFWKKELRKLLECTLETYTKMVDQVRMMMTRYLLNFYSTLLTEFEKVNQFIESTLQNWIRALDDGYRALGAQLNNFKSFDHIWNYFMESNIWKWVQSNWNELYIPIHEEVSLFSKILDISGNILSEKMKEIWQSSLNHKSLRTLIEDSQFWINMRPLDFISTICEKIFVFSVNKESEHLKITVPLVRKAHLLQMAEVGVPEELKSISLKETFKAIIYQGFTSKNFKINYKIINNNTKVT